MKLMKKTTKQNKWFLETSVFINRFLGHSLLKHEIKATIGTESCYTSFFVFYEFRRCVIKTLIELYFQVLEEDQPCDAIAYYKENFSNRENKIVIGALSALISNEDPANNKLKFLINLKRLILDILEEMGNSISEFVNNQAKCPLGKAVISSIEDFEKFIDQTKCKADCNIASFWKAHRNILKILTQEENAELYQNNKEFNKLLPLLYEVIKDYKKGQTIQNCAKLGDVIIAIEMPKSYTMLTFDRSFESLCPLMGKAVKRLPSLSELKKRQSLDQNCQISQTKS